VPSIRTSLLPSCGLLVGLLAFSSPLHAEGALSKRALVSPQLTVTDDDLNRGTPRHWGLGYPIDETYAGPWASSPLSAAPTRVAPHPLTPAAFERLVSGSSTGAGPTEQNSRRNPERLLNGLGPLSLIASVLLPAVMGSASSIGRNDLAPHVGFAKLGRGYGLMLSGRFH
jgi:hypothetical protein